MAHDGGDIKGLAHLAKMFIIIVGLGMALLLALWLAILLALLCESGDQTLDSIH